MKGLFIAEKPSVMKAVQAYVQSSPSVLSKDTLDFTCFHGHLMALLDPEEYDNKYAKWSADTLPILPEKFRYKAVDQASVNKICKMIQNGKYDFLVNATDPEREGEHIFWSFYYSQHLKLPVKRYWSNTNAPDGIRKALQSMFDAEEKADLRQAAFLRAQMDWLIGINFTRALSVNSGASCSMGRVMTPPIRWVVDREEEIQNFKPQKFFEVRAKFHHANGDYEGIYVQPPKLQAIRFAQEASAQKVVDSLGKQGILKSVTTTKSSIKAPTLYSLTELQREANKYFKYTAAATLAIMQHLYEEGWISYPRSDCRVITTDVAKQLPLVMKSIAAQPTLTAYVNAVKPTDIQRVTTDKDYVNDKEAAKHGHHAIIPTEIPAGVLTPEETNIYLLVCKRFLSIFMPPYVTAKTTLITESNGHCFISTGTTEIDKGFTVLYAGKTIQNNLPQVQQGDSVEVMQPHLHSGTTKPPLRYTPASLLLMMEQAGKTVSETSLRHALQSAGGIGTSATRAPTLDKLVQKNFLELKDNYYYPTPLGTALAHTMHDHSICSAELSAEWEQKLHQIEEHTYAGNLKDTLKQYVTTETDKILHMNAPELKVIGANRKSKLSARQPINDKVFGKCPKCQDAVREYEKYFGCTGLQDDSCEFSISKTIKGQKMKITDIRTLLKGEPLPSRTYTSKDGKPFEGQLYLDKTGKPSFTFGSKAA